MTKSSRRSKKKVEDVDIERAGRAARHRDILADFFAERLLAFVDDPDSLHFFTSDEFNPFRLTDVQKQSVLCRLEELLSTGEISEQTLDRLQLYLQCEH